MSSPITIQIKRLTSGQDLPLPARMTTQSAGFDLPAAVTGPLIIPPGAIRVIPTGFAIALPAGYEAQVRPRSGLASKFGVTMVNSPGTIDADYRGEIQIPLINLGKDRFWWIEECESRR